MNGSLKGNLISLPTFSYTDNVLYEGVASGTFSSFEQAYINLRGKENRVYNDESVISLPDISPQHPLADEWAIRKRSLEKLTQYLAQRKSIHTILEVGCGNGWMSKNLVSLNKEVCAIDVNKTELLQAARLFPSDSISFVCSDIYTVPLDLESFDFVILASSIQYFQDLRKLLNRLVQLTKSTGEIHIMDSPLYSKVEIIEAKKRTESYFVRQGQPEMAAYYFHHVYGELEGFDWKFIHDPNSLAKMLQRKLQKTNISPFPWIRIKKNGLDP